VVGVPGPAAEDPVPVTGAWRPGDHPGRRRFCELFGEKPLRLELGGELGDIRVAYETWGTLAADGGNAILVEHALTGDTHVIGPTEPGHPTAGWWEGLVGPGKAIDTDHWFVVCANVLGGCQGTTGPADLAPDDRPFGSRFPRVTVRDQVAVEAALTDALGIDRWAAVVGGSMGGMRVLEWGVAESDRVERVIAIAVGAQASAEQIALQSIQMRTIRLDPRFRGGDYYDAEPGEGPHEGLGLARRLGHLTYRTEWELTRRFARHAQGSEDPLGDGRYAVQSYLDYHAEKLVRRFDANSYLLLTWSMNDHDIGRGRGGVATALGRVRADTLVLGVDSDRLYPPAQQRDLARAIPGADLALVPSPYGHDGFLIEFDAMTPHIRTVLSSTSSATAH
jgi:homoserine O-acetyltransferase/O-succinyltransferase